MIGFTLLSVAGLVNSGPASLPNGDAWHDVSGNQIEAHGGGILKIGPTYHWYFKIVFKIKIMKRGGNLRVHFLLLLLHLP